MIKRFLYLFSVSLLFIQADCSKNDLSNCEANGTAEGLSVTVKSNIDESGIQGASVVITSSSNEYTGFTGSNGIYFVRDIEAGFYEVRAEKNCFQSVFENIDLEVCEGEEKVEITLLNSNFIIPTQLIYSINQNEKSATINNCHSEKVSWSAVPDRSWMTVFPQNGSINANGSISISIEIDRTQLTSNLNYEGKVSISLSSVASGTSLGSDFVDVSVAN